MIEMKLVWDRHKNSKIEATLEKAKSCHTLSQGC